MVVPTAWSAQLTRRHHITVALTQVDFVIALMKEGSRQGELLKAAAQRLGKADRVFFMTGSQNDLETTDILLGMNPKAILLLSDHEGKYPGINQRASEFASGLSTRLRDMA